MTNEERIELLEMHEEVIAIIADYPILLQKYEAAIRNNNFALEECKKTIVENKILLDDLKNTTKELKKRRREKRKWKRRALNYKEAAEKWEQTCKVYEVGLTNMRNRLKNDNKERSQDNGRNE